MIVAVIRTSRFVKRNKDFGVEKARCAVVSLNVIVMGFYVIYSKTCLKRNAIVPVFFFRFHRFPFYKGLCFNKTNYEKHDRLGLQ
jgi:hypothetical protein